MFGNVFHRDAIPRLEQWLARVIRQALVPEPDREWTLELIPARGLELEFVLVQVQEQG